MTTRGPADMLTGQLGNSFHRRVNRSGTDGLSILRARAANRLAADRLRSLADLVAAFSQTNSAAAVGRPSTPIPQSAWPLFARHRARCASPANDVAFGRPGCDAGPWPHNRPGPIDVARRMTGLIGRFLAGTYRRLPGWHQRYRLRRIAALIRRDRTFSAEISPSATGLQPGGTDLPRRCSSRRVHYFTQPWAMQFAHTCRVRVRP